MKKFNWQIWAGLLLSVFAFMSYPLLFARFAVTRDFPWANLLLFALAVLLTLIGVRRAFASGRRRPRLAKIGGSVLAFLSVAILGFFIFSFLIFARWMPAAHGAPRVGQKAPDFTLTDANGKSVSLAELLSSPVSASTASASSTPNERAAGTPPAVGTPLKGVLLIFYRGYW